MMLKITSKNPSFKGILTIKETDNNGNTKTQFIHTDKKQDKYLKALADNITSKMAASDSINIDAANTFMSALSAVAGKVVYDKKIDKKMFINNKENAVFFSDFYMDKNSFSAKLDLTDLKEYKNNSMVTISKINSKLARLKQYINQNNNNNHAENIPELNGILLEMEHKLDRFCNKNSL